MTNYNKAINRKCEPGKTYGYLTVCKFITSKNMWECTCTCGKIVFRSGTALLKYKNPNCGCKKGSYALLPDQLAHKRAIISDYKRHARERNFSFELTDEETIQIISQNCHYCDAPPSNEKTVKPSRKLRNKYACNITSYYYNGIDRIDNTKSYTKENCVSCCHFCNWSKRDYTVDTWKEWIKKVYQKTFNDYSKEVGSSDPKQETPSNDG